jgi:hypothetical protein
MVIFYHISCSVYNGSENFTASFTHFCFGYPGTISQTGLCHEGAEKDLIDTT